MFSGFKNIMPYMVNKNDMLSVGSGGGTEWLAFAGWRASVGGAPFVLTCIEQLPFLYNIIETRLKRMGFLQRSDMEFVKNNVVVRTMNMDVTFEATRQALLAACRQHSNIYSFCLEDRFTCCVQESIVPCMLEEKGTISMFGPAYCVTECKRTGGVAKHEVESWLHARPATSGARVTVCASMGSWPLARSGGKKISCYVVGISM